MSNRVKVTALNQAGVAAGIKQAESDVITASIAWHVLQEQADIAAVDPDTDDRTRLDLIAASDVAIDALGAACARLLWMRELEVGNAKG